MSDKTLALLAIAIVAVPWAIVSCIALLKGYNVKAWRDGPRHKADDDDE